MRYTENELRSLFQRRFNSDDWTRFLGGFFDGARLRAVPEEFDTPTDNDKGFFLGEYITSDHYSIGLFRFDVKAASVARKRVGLRNLVKSLINPRWGMFDAAFAVFVSDTDWRLSFICDIKEEMTAPKRFTYVFGDNEMLYRTPVKRLYDIQEKVTFASLKKAFSVKELSDEFFYEYRDIYADFVQYITGNRYVKKTQGSGYELKSFPREPQNKTFYQALGCDDKRARDFVKKMMGRITFLYFLQQKGWMCSDKNYMLHLFEKSEDKDFYLKKVLVPLFFGVLNTKPAEREAIFTAHGWNHALRKEWESIPYLNGGLFDPDDEDRVVDDCQIHIFRKKDFESLFEFFSHYNFTIDENDPSDAEVGVDPEMLGKIFESLLEDNKDKGAFYTPKEIVQYMCQESLVAYLVTKTGIEENRLHAFVQNPDESVSSFSEDEQYKVLDGILSVKICDPAIGSGAFPIGLLNELVRCKEAIYGDKKGRADIKREIIRDNIYGVDIEKGAIDIARLRFWLSLVVDEDTPTPLPNLNYKIMQGNSLLEWYDGVDLSKLTDMAASDSLFGGGRAEELKLELAGYLKLYFGESDHKKQADLKRKISATIKEILDIAGVSIPDEIDISENNQFFLWHTWYNEVFSQNGGFDICLGNPPYISVRTQNFDKTLKPIYQRNYSLAVGQYDLYVLFIEHASRILSPSGVLSYIIPTRLLSNESFRPARAFLEERLPIHTYVNAEAPFETASVEANIMVCNKGFRSEDVHSYIYDDKTGTFSLLTTVSRNNIEKMPFGIFPFVYPQRVLDLFFKIDEQSVNRLNDFVDITRGFECGYNDKCITQKQTKYKMIKAEAIKPYRLDDSSFLYCQPNFREPAKYKNKKVFESIPKLVTKFCAGYISFSIDTVGYYNTNSVYNCNLKPSADVYYLLAVLNCPVSTYWFNVGYMNIDGLFPHIQKNQLESIPIPNIAEESKHEVSDLVKTLLRLEIDSQEFISIKKHIDGIIYKCLNLTDLEIRMIENGVYV